MQKYDHTKIEKKWQERWESANAFKVDETGTRQKLYVLDMFPYPSGAGLHVGHVEGYTATDIYSRYKRARGFNVLHPMGWDAFGLPAENYAVKTGIHPKDTTAKAIDTFRKQIKSLGLSYDWSREFGTHTPEYYKWTQWLFTKFFEEGLVYKKKALVNWDPVDQTVLANEQVLPDGTAERSGAKVVQKELEQWFFKITEFANELVDDLSKVDWPESTKINQKNWIGRSEGAEIDFQIAGSGEKIKIFTTRPDTLFGATYMVLAPEHSIISTLSERAENKEEILRYIEAAKHKTELERQEGEKEKTGVEIKGVKAINPANKEEIPIFVADYVLGSYGTGAIMAVPAHDERDNAFAKKFQLPIKQVVAPTFTLGRNSTPREGKNLSKRNVVSVILRNQKDEYLLLKWPNGEYGFIGGGIEAGETAREAAIREVKEETGLQNFEIKEEIFPLFYGYGYKERKDVNCFDFETFFVAELKDDTKGDLHPEDDGAHEFHWLAKSEIKKTDLLDHHQEEWRYYVDGIYFYSGDGTVINSGEFDGLSTEEAKRKITAFVGGKWVTTFRLRDWLISRQRYWGAPIPIVYDPEGKPHAIPEKHLPWLLPTDVEFKPHGTSPLGQSKELLTRTEKIFGKGWRPEIDTMDTFMCSSWYFFRFADPHNKDEFASREAMKKWLPVDLYMGGAEHTVLHLLYARFFTKALKRFGLIDFDEPFMRLRHQGTILAEDGNKMSKSKGNVINPDEVVERFGADSLRLYEMFMGPLENMKPWNTKNILGVRRFLERVFKLEVVDEPSHVVLDSFIKKIGDDIEALKFNTAISSLMVLLNTFEERGKVAHPDFEIFIKLLAPFAPHLTHELAEHHSIELGAWPTYDPTKLIASVVTIAVQINGKSRGVVEVGKGATQAEVLAKIGENPSLKKWLPASIDFQALQEGNSGVKVIYVPDRIISFVAPAGS